MNSIFGYDDYSLFMFIEMCPPLLSYNIDIECTLNGNYAN